MALYANLPFALSAGMGLNAYMAYTVVGVMGYEWQVALLAVFVEDLFLLYFPLPMYEKRFLMQSIKFKERCFCWYRYFYCIYRTSERKVGCIKPVYTCNNYKF